MKTKLFIFIMALLPAIIFAEIIDSMPVGPGVMYYHDYLEQGPWHLYILKIDLENEHIQLETAKADDKLAGFEKPSSMAKRKNVDGHKVVAATNGDFYNTSTGVPINAQVLQGELLRQPINREAFGITEDKEPLAGIFSYSGFVWGKNDTLSAIHGINETRNTDYLVLYNKYMGAKTGTNEWGTEVITEYVNDPVINDTVYLEVVAKDSIQEIGHGNNSIPSNGLVLSGHGESRDFLNQAVFIGDTIKMILKLSPETRRIRELIGGGPSMIRNGSVSVPTGSFSSDRHPRTAVGFSQDSSKLFLFVVDGRQSGFSIGMSLYELAGYMLEWGVYHGINFDGGGSSAMVVRNNVMNSPSDGVERSVSNALLIVSTAPVSDFSKLWIKQRYVFLLPGTTKQFSADGYDQYNNKVTYPTDQLNWNCDSNIGMIDVNGLFTAGDDTTSGFIYSVIDPISDSVLIHITTIGEIKLAPDPVILELGEKQQLSATARDYYGHKIDLSQDEYEWSVIGEIGTISATGFFSANTIGEGAVIASYESVADTVPVTVGAATNVLVDDFSDVSNWTVSTAIASGTFTLSTEVYYSEPSSGKMDYNLLTGGTSALYLNIALPISGTPDAVGIYVYGDSSNHWLRGEFKDHDGEKFIVNFTESSPGIDWNNEWQYVEILLEDAIPSWANPSAVLNFPIEWTRIYLVETKDDNKGSGTIYFDDLNIRFIESTGISQNDVPVAEKFQLLSHYPNPFNNTSNFEIQLMDTGNITLTFYNVKGAEVDKMILINGAAGRHIIPWKPNNLSSGIYFYTIKMKSQFVHGKCLLLK